MKFADAYSEDEYEAIEIKLVEQGYQFPSTRTTPEDNKARYIKLVEAGLPPDKETDAQFGIKRKVVTTAYCYLFDRRVIVKGYLSDDLDECRELADVLLPGSTLGHCVDKYTLSEFEEEIV